MDSWLPPKHRTPWDAVIVQHATVNGKGCVGRLRKKRKKKRKKKRLNKKRRQ